MPLNITIWGLNAIGASLGLALGTVKDEALRSGRPVITGWDENQRVLREARNRLIVDREARDIADAVREADVIFVAVAADKLGAAFEAIAPHVKHGAVVSDVSSAKVAALELARHTRPTTATVISGHPLVTPKDTTLDGASIDLFRRAIYCLLPGVTAQANAIDLIDELVTAIGAKPYYIDPAEHDSYIAGAYQLPLVVATALMETLSRSGGWREIQPIAGEALRATTQLVTTPAASADLHNNHAAIELWINELIRTLVDLRDQLVDTAQIEAALSHAQAAHEEWLAAQPNMRPGETDFYQEPENVRPTIGSLFFGQRRKGPSRKR